MSNVDMLGLTGGVGKDGIGSETLVTLWLQRFFSSENIQALNSCVYTPRWG
jgi:hypothetical protein